MMRNYAEATKIFINCLLYVLRTQNVQQQQQPQQRNKSGKYDVVGCSWLSLAILVCLFFIRLGKPVSKVFFDH